MVDLSGVIPTHVHTGVTRVRNENLSNKLATAQDEKSSDIQQKLFVNNQEDTQSSNFGNNSGFMSLNDAGLSGVQFLSQDMGVYVQVITGRMLIHNPELAALVNKFSGKLDTFLDHNDADIKESSGLSSLAPILNDPEFANLSKFQVYMLLYEYYLKKKRQKSDKKAGLSKVGKAVDELEQTETLSLVEGLKQFHQDVEDKLGLIQEFKSSANSYHGEYSDILADITKQYAGNFRSMFKDLIKLNAHNSECAKRWQDRSRAMEQQAFLLDNMHFETKLLNLMSLFCKFEGTEKQLSAIIKECTTLNLTSDLIDLLDGFDCRRLISTKCRVVIDPEKREAAFNKLLNSDIEVVGYLPDKFFKQSNDRANLKARLMECTGGGKDNKDSTPIQNPFSRRQEYF